jgi:3-isopropylmalate dehydratase small subunit
VSDSDELTLDVSEGVIKNLTKGQELSVGVLPPVVAEIMFGGGLIEYYKRKIARGEANS